MKMDMSKTTFLLLIENLLTFYSDVIQSCGDIEVFCYGEIEY